MGKIRLLSWFQWLIRHSSYLERSREAEVIP